jgi:hypothetical protein
MMKYDTPAILPGILMGFLIGAMLNTLPFSDAERYRRAIKECEKTLPRDQHCVVIGVPGK